MPLTKAADSEPRARQVGWDMGKYVELLVYRPP